MHPSQRNTPSSPSAVPFIILLGLVLAGLLSLVLAGPSPAASPIPGWIQVALDPDLDPVILDQKLDQAGASPHISRRNVVVTLSLWGHLGFRSLDSLGAAAFPEDPRHSGYLDTVEGVFYDRDRHYQLIYVAEAPNREALMQKLFDQWGLVRGKDWFVTVSRDGPPAWPPVVLAGLMFLGFFLLSRKRRVLVLPVILPAWPMVWILGLAALPLLALLLYSWHCLFDLLLPGMRRYIWDGWQSVYPWESGLDRHGRQEALGRMGAHVEYRALVFRGGIWLLASLASWVLVQDARGLGAAIGLLVLLLALPLGFTLGFGRYYRWRTMAMEHRGFSPVPIISRGNLFHLPLRPVLPILGTILVGGLALLAWEAALGPLSPSKGWFPGFYTEGTGRVAASLVQDSMADGDDSQHGLPDTRSAARHLLRQLALPWTALRPQAVPIPQGAILVPHYDLLSQGRVATRMETVFDPSDQALAPVLEGLPANCWEKVMLDCGYPGRIVYASPAGVYSRPDWALACFLLAAVLFLLVWILGRKAIWRQWHEVPASFSLARKLAV